MKVSISKRLVSFLLAVVMVLGLMPVVATPQAEAAGVDADALLTAISNLRYPLGERIYNKGDITGLCLILYDNTESGRKHALNPDGLFTTSQDYYGQPGTYQGLNIEWDAVAYDSGTDRPRILNPKVLTYISSVYNKTDRYWFQNYTGYDKGYGSYWNFAANNLQSWFGDFTLGDACDLSIEGPTNSRFTVKAANKPNGKDGMWVMAGNWSYRVTYQVADVSYLYFYRVSEQGIELYNALKNAATYLTGNGDGRYDPAVYEEFLETVNHLVDTYITYESKSWSEQETNFKKKGQQLWDLMGKLKLNDSAQEYMDIPIEVLDFRGDGLLFEADPIWESPYSLTRKSDGVGTDSFPGNYVVNGPGDDFQVEGLVESTLVDGKVVYTKKTVDYIAYHLYNRTDLKAPVDNMNGAFYQKIMGGTLTYSADGYGATVDKCKGGKAGGELSWGQVTTYHDLAYYLLSHMWSSTSDVLGQNSYDTYNMKISELSKLRLFKDGQTYSFTSYGATCSEYGYIFNDSTTRPARDPYFRPLTDKGFESPSLYGTHTEGYYYKPEVNYCFTIHAYGGFMYTEDSDLYFYFGGDDDVYFYINGQLICDIGGVHGNVSKTRYLNDYATALGLKDGQICRFDMFYADRHTTGINMNLSTNIQIMDESVITEKTQYLPENDQALMDGAVVSLDTTVGYAFSLLNRRTGPLKDVQFADSKLDVSLDGKAGKVKLNGQPATDLTLIYGAYNIHTGEVYAGTAQAYKPEEYTTFKNLIDGAVRSTESATPLGTGAYSYVPQSEAELIELLKLGIPASCKLTIRGFKHKVTQVGEFYNSLSTVCTPVRYDATPEGGVVAVELDPITGVASCRVKGMDLDIAAGDPYAVVLDYGKPVELDPSKTYSNVELGDGFRLTYIGSTFNGEHGTVRTKQPLNLTFTATGQTMEGDHGTFRMTDNHTLRYSPEGFIEDMDSFYAVYKVTIEGEAAFAAYLMIEVAFLPANMVYYEAENLVDELSLTKKTADKGTQTQWNAENYKTEGTKGGEVQEHAATGTEILYRDYTNNPDVLFFGFDNTAEDVERYTNASNGYGGYNYDNPATVNTYWKGNDGVKTREISIDQAEGALKIIATPEAKGSDPTNKDQYYPDVFVDTIYGGIYSYRPLRYNPKNAEIYQVRFKMKNFRIGTDINNTNVMPYVAMQYQTVDSVVGDDDTFYTADTWQLSYRHFHTYVIDGEQYVVMTLYNSEEFRNSGTVNKIRVYFAGIESISASQLGEVYIDYIYIGPYDLAPVEPTYGWDSAYLRNDLLSDGESLYVEGNGVRIPTNPNPDKYTEINFTFTGTGFDLITRTGEQQGTLRVEVYKDSDRSKAVKTLTVNNKGVLELYQIPTISVQDLEHDTYYVSVMVNEANTTAIFEALRRGNQLYLDAVRIYDPIDVSAGKNSVDRVARVAYGAYCADGEAHPIIQEVREILLSAMDFNALDGTSTSGAVYVDYREEPTETVPVTDADGNPTGKYETVTPPGVDITDHVTKVISTYDKVGPKNEVYLSGGQAIAFKLVVYSQQIPSSLDIGCKIIDGNYVRLHGRVSKGSGDVRQALFLPIYSGTAQYYSLPLWEARFNEGTDENGIPMRYIYVVLENFKAPDNMENTSGILSITDIKVAYDCEPTPYTPGSNSGSDSGSDNGSGSGSGGSGGGNASDSDVKLDYDGDESIVARRSVNTRNGEVELPVDSFVDFVVDGELWDVVGDILNEQEAGPCDHSTSYWITVREPSVGREGIRNLRCPLCGEILDTETFGGISALAFSGASVSLQSDLSIHYKVDASFFTDMGYADPFVIVVNDGMETVIRDYTVKDGKYSFVYKNIAPHRIGDTVTATLYAYYDGVLYASESRDYSVADYCYNMLGKTAGNDNFATLRTLLVDLLLYGAKTQEYTAYRLDSLCTARLTEEQLAMGTELTREIVNHRNQAVETIENPTVAWKGAGLNLKESVAVRFRIEAESYEGLEVRFTIGGKTYTIGEADFDYRADGTYVHFVFLNAAQMSEPIYGTVYRDGVAVSNTMCYSIESYAFSKQNDTTYPHLADLVKRMMCYGDSARAYVGN